MNLWRRVVTLAALAVAAVVLSACAQSERAAGGADQASAIGSPNGLSVSDVERLFEDWSALVASELDDRGVDYHDAFRDVVLRTVDFRSWAEDEVRSMPRSRWSQGEPIELVAEAKSATIADALVVYDRIRADQGALAAYEAVVGAWDAVEHDPQADLDEELLFVLAPHLGLLSFMTQPPQDHGTPPRPEWSWQVISVALEGADSARIRFTAKSFPEAGWSFKDPSRVYEKLWRFTYDSGQQRWLLSSWPNRTEFIDSVRTNLVDPSGVLSLDSQPFWWMMG